MISAPHLGLGVALAASCALGVSVRSGRLELGRRRWLHHALYGTCVAGAIAATVIDAARSRPTWPVAAGTLGLLVALPATSGGSRAHLSVAAVTSAVYLTGSIAVVRRSTRE
jgi:hypothetical protein